MDICTPARVRAAGRRWVSTEVAGGRKMRLDGALRCVVVALLVPAAAFAGKELPPLEDNRRVQHEFLAAAVGDAIRKNCPTISSRMFRVIRRLHELRNYVYSLGYTRGDLDRMRRSPEAKARLADMRDAYLEEHGVTEGDAGSYCRLGHEEINKSSLTGWILRAR